jgi:hypothetical protein
MKNKAPELSIEEINKAFDALVDTGSYSSENGLYSDFVEYVNKDWSIIFFETLHNPDCSMITNIDDCKDHHFIFIEKQKSICQLFNETKDLNIIKARLLELKEYLKKFFKVLGHRRVEELKNEITYLSLDVVRKMQLVELYDLDDRSVGSELNDKNQGLLKGLSGNKSGLSKCNLNTKKFEFDFSALQKKKKKKR